MTLVSSDGRQCRSCGVDGWVPNAEQTECTEELEACKGCGELSQLIAAKEEMTSTDRECYQQCQQGDANEMQKEADEDNLVGIVLGSIIGFLTLCVTVGVATRCWIKKYGSG